MTQTTSYGICAICGKRTSKAAMTRHLKRCSADHEPSRGRPAHLFHLRVEDAYSSIFWLDLEMKTSSTLADLDAFLREIWLECCGHLSAFDIEGTTYAIPYEEAGPLMDELGDRSMNVKLEEVLDAGTRFYHTYDFGTPTELTLRVVGALARVGQRQWGGGAAVVGVCEVCYGGENQFWFDVLAAVEKFVHE